MATRNDLYRKLKRQAKRLLLQGDVQRYLHTLRELHAIGTLRPGMTA